VKFAIDKQAPVRKLIDISWDGSVVLLSSLPLFNS